ncbi:MAG: lyase family protein, partial [Clostridia bacterium]|nr:lyase family protein [Clostridia bacterium]
MKLWGGRFAKSTDSVVEDFHSSISFDARLYKQDITGSLAHAQMLADCAIITQDEADQIKRGLLLVLEDIENGRCRFEVEAEDIHMNIEKLLTEKIGGLGKKLHTARSRNDQVAVDTRLWFKAEVAEIFDLLKALEQEIIALAKQHDKTIMPGYTHLQRAQPISFAHHLLAYFNMFARDLER